MFVGNGGMCLYIENLYGENNYYIVESCFKVVVWFLCMVVVFDVKFVGVVVSIKGSF